MTPSTLKAVTKAVDALMNSDAKTAIAYVSRRDTVKVTRRFKIDRRNRTTDLVLTIGEPGYREREFIKDAVKAGEMFPIRKVQLRNFPQPRV